MNDVVENGPAWESGVRAGDVIVTVNDWLIVLMDRPQVIWSLLRIDEDSAVFFTRPLFRWECIPLKKSSSALSQQNFHWVSRISTFFLLSIELALIG